MHSPFRAWLALAVLTLPALLVSIDNTVLGVALPAISTALRPDATTLLWVVDVYPLVLAGLLVTMGTLGDRIGRRRMLMIGVGGFGLVSLVAAYATDAVQLVAARAALGVFGAMLMPSTLALLRTVFTDRAQRRIALAVWATGFAAGAALGPIVAGVLLEHFWWGSVFAVNVPVTALLLVAGLVLLPESRMPDPERTDLVSAVLTLLTMAPLVLAVKLVGSGGVTVAAIGSALVGVAAGYAFVERSRRLVRAGRRPLIDLGLFSSPVLRHSALANATTMFGLTGLLFFAAQYLQLVLGASPMRAGLLLLPGFVATVLAGLASARLARRVPLHVLVPAGLALVLAGYVLCLWLSVHTAVLIPVVAAVLIGTGIGLSETATNDAILAAVPPERAGAASAVSETAYEIGAVLGTALLGGLLSAVYRGSVVLPDGTPAAAGETLGAAVDSARVLPPEPASALLGSAREAFADGVDVAAGAGAVVVATVLVVTAVGLRRVWRPRVPNQDRNRPRSTVASRT
ncbi:MFS transporter [Pseudonocardia endophytica]|uniref:DHA2 family multidrug resistance protein-like MFS transporter n=1 Tax=Pseudonocardia endophytica TaxID=401976 RepID=A0A4V2PJA1_PSEEN|nr:MFS transporter [Pseudonocardia endophytica]TCK27726.1 DHA2 family multidrug resistance protein-like MFS transporter [Pseudonocardia endophytica]